MLQRSSLCLWVPNYYRGGKTQKHGRSGPASRESIRPAHPLMKTSSSLNKSHLDSPSDSTKPQTRVLSSSFYLGSTPLEGKEVVTAASALLTQWRQASNSWHSNSSHGHLLSSNVEHAGGDQDRCLDVVRFKARQEVLSILPSLLPPPPLHLAPGKVAHASKAGTMAINKKAGSKLRVVEVDKHGNPVLAPSSCEAVSSASGASHGTSSRSAGNKSPLLASYSLEELVVLLQLYHLTEYEDGQLLLQLLGEVDRFIFGNVQQNGRASKFCGSTQQPRVVVKLPLPELLLMTANVGVIEERTLQAIVRKPTSPPASTGRIESVASVSGAHQFSSFSAGSGGGGGILYKQLALYTEAELLTLLVALHKFELHQEYCFERTVKALCQRMWKPRSVATLAFRSGMKQCMKEAASRKVSSSPQPQALSMTEEGGTQSDVQSPCATVKTLDLPPLPNEMACSISIMVDALLALSLSVFRRTDAVNYCASILAVAAVELIEVQQSRQQQQQCDTSPPIPRTSALAEDAEGDLMVLARQLLFAAKLCEEMGVAQIILAQVFARCCSVSGKGVVMDGGEDAEISSERIAFYDHVTADLVKINRLHQ